MNTQNLTGLQKGLTYLSCIAFILIILLFGFDRKILTNFEIFSQTNYPTFTNTTLGYVMGFAFSGAYFVFKEIMNGNYKKYYQNLTNGEKYIFSFFSLCFTTAIFISFIVISNSDVQKMALVFIAIGSAIFENGPKPFIQANFN